MAVVPRLARLSTDGPEDFYRGALASALLDGLGRAGSVLGPEDFASFAPVVEPPLVRTVLGMEVATSPPNSQGFVLLAMLQAAEALGAGDPLGPACWRPWLEDLSPSLPAPGMSPGGEDGPPRPGGDTVAVVTADSEGRAVSLIQSLVHSFARTLMPVLASSGGRLRLVAGAMGARAQPQNGGVRPGRAGRGHGARPSHRRGRRGVRHGERPAKRRRSRSRQALTRRAAFRATMFNRT